MANHINFKYFTYRCIDEIIFIYSKLLVIKYLFQVLLFFTYLIIEIFIKYVFYELSLSPCVI
jgi:hypothetical protein